LRGEENYAARLDQMRRHDRHGAPHPALALDQAHRVQVRIGNVLAIAAMVYLTRIGREERPE